MGLGLALPSGASPRILPPLTWPSWCPSEKPGESPGAFCCSWEFCLGLHAPGRTFRVSDLACRSRRTERAGDVVMMAVLPVEPYLPDGGFLTFP